MLSTPGYSFFFAVVFFLSQSETIVRSFPGVSVRNLVDMTNERSGKLLQKSLERVFLVEDFVASSWRLRIKRTL